MEEQMHTAPATSAPATTHRHALDAGRGLTPHTPLDVIDLEPKRRALPRLDRQDLLNRVPPQLPDAAKVGCVPPPPPPPPPPRRPRPVRRWDGRARRHSPGAG